MVWYSYDCSPHKAIRLMQRASLINIGLSVEIIVLRNISHEAFPRFAWPSRTDHTAQPGSFSFAFHMSLICVRGMNAIRVLIFLEESSARNWLSQQFYWAIRPITRGNQRDWIRKSQMTRRIREVLLANWETHRETHQILTHVCWEKDKCTHVDQHRANQKMEDQGGGSVDHLSLVGDPLLLESSAEPWVLLPMLSFPGPARYAYG